MNAKTGNRMWEKRYREYEKKLDIVVKQSNQLAPDLYASEIGKKNDAAIKKLVELEYQSFELVKIGKKEAAQNILLGEEYKNEKQKHTNAITQINNTIYEQVDSKNSKNRQKLLITSSLAK